jgi:PAS domain S-box-containing protein
MIDAPVALRDDNGSTGAIIGSDVDVPLEDASFLRAVLEAVPAFIVRLDPDQRISYINHLRGGVTLQQVLGRPVREFIAPEDFERWQIAVQQALHTGERSSYLARGSRAVTANGAAYYEGHAVPIDNGDGRRGVCIVATDVSEHVARAQALQESEEKLRVALEATGLGLWTWDIANDRAEWDQQMIDMMGCEPLLPDAYIARVVHEDDRARMLSDLSEARKGRPTFLEHRIVRPDGQVRWMLPCGRVTKDEHGHVVRITGGTLDVTTQRLVDERLREAQKMDAVGNLTAGVAHNFNNMLAVIVPSLELAQRNADADQRRLFEDATHAARRATELVTQLMKFAGQRRALRVAPHDLAHVLQRAVSMCQRTFERQVQIEMAIDPGCAKVACDPMAIEQVVVNLLINARHAVIETGRIESRIVVEMSEVETTRPDAPTGASERFVRIRVQDNGVGMTDAVKQRLFEPFFTTKRYGQGTGLGLATSYGIVRDHGGFITLESQPDLGTMATILLMPAPEASAQVVDEPPCVPEVRPGTILVVDDEPAVRRVVELLLAERGHDVQVASDGESAVAALDAGLVPDLILLDRSMPGWPTKLTLGEIRKRVGRTPIVFFTGQDVNADECLEVQDVLYKPLATDELVRQVERWLAQR